jgi:CRISPR-associated protein Cas5
MKIDLNYLLEKPDMAKTILLTINPLAPLSMVSSMPGSYYKTERSPNKFMICGLFENILNLHISDIDRNAIRKKIKGYYKKEYKLNYELTNSEVGYKPILNHLFEIEQPYVIPDMMFYEDLWTQHLIGKDERHLKGSVNYDWKIENKMVALKKNNNTNERNTFFSDNLNSFPRYYRSPRQREFLITNGEYLFKIKLTSSLLNLLKSSIEQNNIGYLGTSEGWVNISFEENV